MFLYFFYRIPHSLPLFSSLIAPYSDPCFHSCMSTPSFMGAGILLFADCANFIWLIANRQKRVFASSLKIASLSLCLELSALADLEFFTISKEIPYYFKPVMPPPLLADGMWNPRTSGGAAAKPRQQARFLSARGVGSTSTPLPGGLATRCPPKRAARRIGGAANPRAQASTASSAM